MTRVDVARSVAAAIRLRAIPTMCQAGHYRGVDCDDPRPCGACEALSACSMPEVERERVRAEVRA